jgi:hypothetical protein
MFNPFTMFLPKKMLGIDIGTGSVKVVEVSRWGGGKTLENYGEFWHIDHVKPCASFDLSKEEDIEKCFSWMNTRPLRSDKNKIKRDKIIPFDILMQELKVNVYLKGINKNESKSNQSIIKGSVIDVNS